MQYVKIIQSYLPYALLYNSIKYYRRLHFSETEIYISYKTKKNVKVLCNYNYYLYSNDFLDFKDFVLSIVLKLKIFKTTTILQNPSHIHTIKTSYINKIKKKDLCLYKLNQYVIDNICTLDKNNKLRKYIEKTILENVNIDNILKIYIDYNNYFYTAILYFKEITYIPLYNTYNNASYTRLGLL